MNVSAPASKPSRSPVESARSASLGMRIQLCDASVWETEVAPVVSALESFLPSPAILVSAPRRELHVSWASGPSPAQLRSLLVRLLGADPQSEAGGRLISWRGLQVSFRRASLPAARGFALLSAALAGPCPHCEPDSRLFFSALSAASERPEPQLLSSHPNLTGLSALGLDLSFLERLAELVGSLCDGPGVPAGFFHERGHLPGLVELARSLDVL